MGAVGGSAEVETGLASVWEALSTFSKPLPCDPIFPRVPEPTLV